LRLISERNGNGTPADDVRLITITVGANDFLDTFRTACSTGDARTCDSALIEQLSRSRADVRHLLGVLREAAGPDTTIAVSTLYNASGTRVVRCTTCSGSAERSWRAASSSPPGP
jgi:hypothetical protein